MEAVQHFNDYVQQAAWEATLKPSRSDNNYEYSSDIREKVAHKRKIRKL